MQNALTLGFAAVGFSVLTAYIRRRDRRLATEVTSAINDDTAEEADERVWVKRCMVMAAQAARAKFGLMNDTPACREIVGRFIREYMSRPTDDDNGMGMRPSHVIQMSPGALELYFIPCEGDFLAHRIRQDKHVRAHKQYKRW